MFYYVLITFIVVCTRSTLGSLMLSEKVPLNLYDDLQSAINEDVNVKGLDIFGFDRDSIILSEKVPIHPEDGVSRPPPPVGEDRIVGGREADIEDNPYQVSFIVNSSYFCGGIIISENYIMTAAHCAQNVDPTTVVLRAGSSWRKNGTIIPIAEVTPHPEYDNPAFDKDVAVMKTVEPLMFNERMQPIGLPEKDEPVDDGGMVMASGWGRTVQGAPTIPERLMEVEIPVVSYFRCMLVYYSVLTGNMLCAGNFFLGGQGTCQGDSGGAAVQNDKVVGITSFGRGCAQPLSPSVFAKVSAPTIRDFIKEQTGL